MDKSAPPTAEQRRICWNARDKFFACAQQYLSEEDQIKHCEKLKEAFEASCPKTWVSSLLLVDKTNILDKFLCLNSYILL